MIVLAPCWCACDSYAPGLCLLEELRFRSWGYKPGFSATSLFMLLFQGFVNLGIEVVARCEIFCWHLSDCIGCLVLLFATACLECADILQLIVFAANRERASRSSLYWESVSDCVLAEPAGCIFESIIMAQYTLYPKPYGINRIWLLRCSSWHITISGNDRRQQNPAGAYTVLGPAEFWCQQQPFSLVRCQTPSCRWLRRRG